ncbi:ferrochelatase [Candidatus Marsarchaeota archaeon]|nr:ferrochelatase [Candidatus Marsarchaeota archaeon]MCL5404242.1 ferrochelatase [Candidatus Marsarchaeota archaeon]
MYGVLLMAYGTPQGLNGISDYYTNIMKGKSPTKEQLKRLTDRYKAIGGKSPLLEVTRSQAEKLQKKIARSDSETKVFYGMKYSKPYVYDALLEAKSFDVDKLICIPIAPFYSAIGTGSYYEHVDNALAALSYKPALIKVASWNLQTGLIKAWTDCVSALKLGKSDVMVFTAHSMPATKRDDLSVYRKQILQTCNAVQSSFGNRWALSFQSAADMPGNWIGPDAGTQISGLARNGVKSIAIIPIGFVADNLETMYDVGIAYKALAEGLGMKCKISGMPNDSEGIIDALYGVYADAIRRF